MSVAFLAGLGLALLTPLRARADVPVFTKTCVDENGGQLCDKDWVTCTLHVEVATDQENFSIYDIIKASFFYQWKIVQGPPAPAVNKSLNEGVNPLVANGQYRYDNVIMDPGASFDFVYRAQVKAQAWGTTSCQAATIRDGNLNQWFSNDECLTYDCLPPNTPNVQATKQWSGPSPVVVGTPVTFVILVKNSGDAADNNIRVTDTLDSTLFTSPSVTFNPSPNGGGANGYVIDATWTALAVGATITINVDTVYANCSFAGLDGPCNQAFVTSDWIKANIPAGQRGSDNPDSPTFGDATCRAATAGGSPSITTPPVKEMTDLNGPPIALGDRVHVKVTFQNTSYCSASFGHFEDVVPAELTYDAGYGIQVTPNSGTKTYDAPNKKVIADAFTVDGVATTTVEFEATVNTLPANGKICNTGQYRFGVNNLQNTTQACITSQPPDLLALDKTHDDADGKVTGGQNDQFDWIIHVYNQGAQPVVNATIHDVVPNCFSIVSVSPPGMVVGNVVDVTLPNVPVGAAPVDVTIKVQENGTCAPVQDSCNSASANSPNSPAPVASNSKCITIDAPVACPTQPGRIYPLLAVKVAPAARFSWPQEANSVKGYRVYSVTAKALLPAEGANAAAVLQCSTNAIGNLTCDDPDAITDPSSNKLFYDIVGVCLDGTEGAQ